MTQTFTTRFTALFLAAAIVTTAWLPTVTVPLSHQNSALVATIA